MARASRHAVAQATQGVPFETTQWSGSTRTKPIRRRLRGCQASAPEPQAAMQGMSGHIAHGAARGSLSTGRPSASCSRTLKGQAATQLPDRPHRRWNSGSSRAPGGRNRVLSGVGGGAGRAASR